MNCYELKSIPDRVEVYNKKELRWDAEVSFHFTQEGMVPQLKCRGRVETVLLKWRQKIDDETTRFMGDHFERSYGDLRWHGIEPEHRMFWYFFSTNSRVSKGYGVKTSPNAACIWYVDNEWVTLELDTRSGSYGVDLKGRQLDLCEIVELSTQGDVYELQQAFCERMCPQPVLPREKVYGANTWYNTYGYNLTEEVVLTYTDRLVSMTGKNGLWPYMVIDDGWQIASDYDGSDYRGETNGGPWLPHRKFGDMKLLADRIKDMGAKPGIWIRPLLSAFEVDEEVQLKGTVKVGSRQIVLDPTHPKVLDRVGEDVGRIARDWGFQLIKHDFTTYDIYGQWGFKMMAMGMGEGIQNPEDDVRFYDDTITTVEAVKQLYRVIAGNKGDDCIILGCNTVSHLTAGVFEACRIGDDTSGYDFGRTRKMGVNAMAFRMAQHKRFYAVDGDCVGIKPGAIGWEQNREWLALLAESGSPLFYSADFEALTDEVIRELKAAMKKNIETDSECCRPLDWQFRQYPERWQLASGFRNFNWYL